MTWDDRWPRERWIAFVRDEMPEDDVKKIFESMLIHDGGFR